MKKKKIKFDDIEEGQWIEPIRKKYLLKCCKCGLVHRVDFRLVKKGKGKRIQFRMFRKIDKFKEEKMIKKIRKMNNFKLK